MNTVLAAVDTTPAARCVLATAQVSSVRVRSDAVTNRSTQQFVDRLTVNLPGDVPHGYVESCHR